MGVLWMRTLTKDNVYCWGKIAPIFVCVLLESSTGVAPHLKTCRAEENHATSDNLLWHVDRTDYFFKYLWPHKGLAYQPRDQSCNDSIIGNLSCCDDTRERKSVCRSRQTLYFHPSLNKTFRLTMTVPEHASEQRKLMDFAAYQCTHTAVMAVLRWV